jgi:hypothetical protein
MKKAYYKALSISYTHLALSHSFNVKALEMVGDSDNAQFYDRLAIEAEARSEMYLKKSEELPDLQD